MTNEQLQLVKELKNELISRGFEVYADNENAVCLVRNGDYEIEEDKFYSNYAKKELTITHLNGYTINVNEVYRNNGTDENKSARINVYKNKRSSAWVLESVKISQKDGARKRQNAINKIVEAYEQAVKQ